MEFMIALIIFVVIAAGVYYVGRDTHKQVVNEAAKKSITAADEAARKSISAVDGFAKKSAQEATRLTSNLSQSSRGLLSRFGIGKEDKLGSYRAWIGSENVAKDAGSLNLATVLQSFQDWVGELPDKEARIVSELAHDFGADLNFELAWVNDPEFAQSDPELKKALDEALLFYSLAFWKASQVQENIHLLLAVETWEKDPYKGSNQEITQKMFAKMVDERLVKPSHELLLAPEKERRDFVETTVRAYAQRDPKAFNVMFKSTIAEVLAPKPKQVDKKQADEAVEGEVVEENKPAQKRVSRRQSGAENVE